MIKRYEQFITEVYQVLDTDSSAVTALKNEVNNLQKWIMEYPRKKSIIDNIYMSFQNDKELISKLRLQKIVRNFEIDDNNPQRVSSTNVKDIKQIEVINPLINEYIKIAQKKREIRDINEDIEKQKQTIRERQQSAQGNERLAPSFQKDIDSMNTKIGDLQKEIENLESQIKATEQNMKLKIQQMRIDIQKKLKLLDAELQNRKQTDIMKPPGETEEKENKPS